MTTPQNNKIGPGMQCPMLFPGPRTPHPEVATLPVQPLTAGLHMWGLIWSFLKLYACSNKENAVPGLWSQTHVKQALKSTVLRGRKVRLSVGFKHKC